MSFPAVKYIYILGTQGQKGQKGQKGERGKYSCTCIFVLNTDLDVFGI